MRTTLLLGAFGALALACNPGGENSPKAEVTETQVKLDLPAPPEFKVPQPLADGSQTPTTMRLRWPKFLEQPVKVTGYVVSVYDAKKCAHELGAKQVKENPSLCAGKGEVTDCTFKVGQKTIEQEPELCQRPHFYLADAPGASIEKAVLVVDVPRPVRADEKEDFALVQEAKLNPPPDTEKFLTDQTKVTVSGTWSQKSPKGFTRSDGLLVYQTMAPAPM
jgi:hypothetical protein